MNVSCCSALNIDRYFGQSSMDLYYFKTTCDLSKAFGTVHVLNINFNVHGWYQRRTYHYRPCIRSPAMEESCVTNLDIGLNLQPPCRIIAHNWSVTQTNKNCDNMPETTNIILPQEAAFKQDDLVGTKKHGARRNPWGNLSYADLIAKAIESSVEKRLTLAQIYDWIVLNVPYFRDKGDNNSAAGWKVIT